MPKMTAPCPCYTFYIISNLLACKHLQVKILYIALLFSYGQSSRGVATPIRDTPRDVLSMRKSNGQSKY